MGRFESYPQIVDLEDSMFVVETSAGTRRMTFAQLADYFQNIINNGGIGEAINTANQAVSIAIEAAGAANSAAESMNTTLAVKAAMQPLDASGGIIYTDIPEGIHQVTVGGVLHREEGDTGITLVKGDIITASDTHVLQLISINDGMIYSLYDNVKDWENSYYATTEEVKELLDGGVESSINEIAQQKGYATAEVLQNAIDKISKYKLIADVTTEEDISYYARLRVGYSKIKIYIDAPAAGTQNALIVKASDTYEGTDIDSGTLIVIDNALNTDTSQTLCTIESSEFGTCSSVAYGTQTSMGANLQAYNPDITSITKILIRTGNAETKIPKGTKIKIWGY